MGKSPRKRPRLPKANPKIDEEPKSDPAPIIFSSDDEADDDLSLKIVKKAMLRASGNENNTNASPFSTKHEEIITKVKKKTHKRKEKMGARDNAVEGPKFDSAPIILKSNKDAHDDQNLKIVEKAVIRACGNKTNMDPSSSSSKHKEVVTKVKKKIKKRKEKEKMGAQDSAVEGPKSDPAPIILSSNEDADDDLSLKIVEKAMLRACADETNTDPSSSSSKHEEIVIQAKKKTKKGKEKKEKMGARDNAAEDMHTKEDGAERKESDVILETNPAENIVLQKLLRGPRYFDPPDNNWGNCYNCGEGGHITANCTSAKRKKPCFVCGSFDHNVKQCNKGKDCFICKKGGHRAKDCPEKSIGGPQNTKICLKCGDSGHEMFLCKSLYSPDDLKAMECYVCKCFGHICCINYDSAGPREVSCYRCGQLGHTGWECGRVHTEIGTPSLCYKCGEEGHMARKCTTSAKECGRVHAEIGTPSYCYKCGEEGHMARKCTTSAKKEKRKSEFSSPRKSHSHIGVRSVPHDLGKKNKTQKQRSRGGWITNEEEWESSKYQDSSSYKRFYNSNGRKLHYETAIGGGYQQRFSAARFSYGKKEYSWDD